MITVLITYSLHAWTMLLHFDPRVTSFYCLFANRPMGCIQSMWAERERSGKRSGAGGKRHEREWSGEREL